MSDYLSMILDNLQAYVFGSNLLFGMFLLIVINVLMFKLNISLDGMIVIDIPFLFVFGLSTLGWFDTWAGTIVTFLIGMLISYFMYVKILRR